MASTSVNRGWGPSKMATEAMCMWLTSSSRWRNEASCGLSRSGLMGRSLQEETWGLRARTVLPTAEEFSCSDGFAGLAGLVDGGQEGGGEDPLPGLFVGGFDHPRPAILRHG